jgi:3-oxoacyl-[acyl-carrier protein] reductase
MTDLNGKVAFITGGSKGIGFGIAESLLGVGMKVVITSRSQASADASVDSLKKKTKNDQVLGLECDVRDFASQEKAVASVIKHFGSIDVLIANAGVGHFGSVEDITIDQWQETIDTNLSGAFFTLKAGLEALKATKGYYISISSLAGTNFFAGASAYNASKFGLTGFTQAAMLDIRKYGIRSTTIMPGSVATNFGGHTPNDKDGWKIQIEDMGQMVLDLLRMNPRTLPSKIEVRPTSPPS